MAKQRKEEEDFQAKVMGNAQWKAAYGGAWEAIAGAERKPLPAPGNSFSARLNSQFATLR